MTKDKLKDIKERVAYKNVTNDTRRWVISFILLFMSLFVLLSVVSYYFTWSTDQEYLFARGGEEPFVGEVANGGGKLGVLIGYFFVGKLFGLFALCMPVAFIILSLRILKYKPVLLDKVLRVTLMAMILGSLTLGLAFGTSWGVFGTGLGGEEGIFVAEWLRGIIGRLGLWLLLILSWILLAVYINRKTINVVNSVGEAMAKTATDILIHKNKDDDTVQSDTEEKTHQNDWNDDDVQPDHIAESEHDCINASSSVAEDVRDGSATASMAANANGATDVTSRVFVSDNPADDSYWQDSVPQRDANVADSQTLRSAVTDDETGYGIDELQEDERPLTVDIDDVDASRKTIRSLEERNPLEDDRYVMLDDDAEARKAALERLNRTRQSVAKDDFEIVDMGGGMAGLPSEVGGAKEQNQSQHDQSAEAAVAQSDDIEVRPASEIGGVKLGTGGIIESVGKDDVRIVKHENVDAVAEEDDIDLDLYDPTRELSNFHCPPLEILERRNEDVEFSPEEINENKNQIQLTLENFGIKINRIKATIGPTVTLYEIEPAQGIKIARIKSLEDNIALDLKALSIRIIAPIPGKGTIGIEIPNRTRQTVSMYSVVKSLKFQDSKYELPVVLGKTIQNETFVIDLAKMPHLLVAGATGQGKSVGLNVIIASLLYKKHPAELKFIMVDPKKVELSLYSKLEKHYLAKMESEDSAILTDTQKVVYTLNSLCVEMEARYELLRRAEVKKISEYNQKFLQRRLPPDPLDPNGLNSHRFLPYLVVVIDEFADMIMTAGKEVEAPITRLAQLARAVGIHLIIATQRPDVKVITGLIKANFPARIAFRVTSMVDSRTILDQPGANQLVGQGDMLMMLNGDLTRLQCAFIDTPEIERITAFISRQKSYTSAYLLPDYSPEDSSSTPKDDLSQTDSMFAEIARFVVQHQQGSTSYIQRRFSIGYNRAGRIMDQLESAGIVGRPEGSKPREVLVYDMAQLESILAGLHLS